MAEHLDHLYYVNDIICLGVDSLNEVVCDHLLNRLLIPLYVYSLTDQNMMPDGVSRPTTTTTSTFTHCVLTCRKRLHTSALPFLSSCWHRSVCSQTILLSISHSQHLQVFLIISHPPLVTALAYLIFTGDTTLTLPPVLQHTAPVLSQQEVCLLFELVICLRVTDVRDLAAAFVHL